MISHILGIPDNRHGITFALMRKLDQLLHVWENSGPVGPDEGVGVYGASSLVAGSDAEKEKANLKSKVESMCLLYLCCPLLAHRFEI